MQIASPKVEAKHDLLPSISSPPQGLFDFPARAPAFRQKAPQRASAPRGEAIEESLYLETTVSLAIFGALEVPFILCPATSIHAISRLKECMYRCLLLQLFGLHLATRCKFA